MVDILVIYFTLQSITLNLNGDYHICNHIVYRFFMYLIELKIEEYEFDSRATIKHYILCLFDWNFFDHHFPCFCYLSEIQEDNEINPGCSYCCFYSSNSTGLQWSLAECCKVGQSPYLVRHVFSV